MTLDDIHYFRYMKAHKPSVYNLAKKVGNFSEPNESDKQIYQTKIDNLATVPGENDEQRRQAADLLCEFKAFDNLHSGNLSPHWVTETGRVSPDIEYEKDGRPG